MKNVIESVVLSLPKFKQVLQVDFDCSGTNIRMVTSEEGIPIAFFHENLNEKKKIHFIYDQ